MYGLGFGVFFVAVTNLQNKQWFWILTVFYKLLLWMSHTSSVQIKESTV